MVLVEAKAHSKELESLTGAKVTGGLPKIEKAFDLEREGIGVTEYSPWAQNYYQLANHIFTSWYLNEIRKIPSVLLNIYFVGDDRLDGFTCPQTVFEWEEAIQKEYDYLGISTELPFIKKHVKLVFIQVNGEPFMQLLTQVPEALGDSEIALAMPRGLLLRKTFVLFLLYSTPIETRFVAVIFLR